MPGTVIGKVMNLGYYGKISRDADAIVDQRVLNKSLGSNVAFGTAMLLNSDNTVAPFVGATSTVFAGIAVAEVKQATDYSTQTSSYAPGAACDFLTRGAIIVKCVKGTPTAGGVVYVRKTLNATYPNALVGDFEAEADSTNTVALTNVTFTTGIRDANNAVEVTILSKLVI